MSGRAAPRSRAGCYTCRSRKVRCDEEISDGGKCATCSRLRFDCRWQKPGPEDSFEPPPKRRRNNLSRQRGSSVADDCEEGGGGAVFAGGSTSAGIFSPEIAIPVELEAVAASLEVPNTSYSPTGEEWMNEMDSLLNSLRGAPNTFPSWDDGLDFFMPAADFEQDFPALPPLPSAAATGTAAWTYTDNAFSAGPQDDHKNASAVQSHSYIDNSLAPSATPTIDETNRVLIQHYLEVMKSYSKVQDRVHPNNFYISAFAKALTRPFLFNAILAYSATHLSLTDQSHEADANRYAHYAASLLLQTTSESHTEEAEIEGLLSGCFILLQRENMVAQGHAGALALLQTASVILASDGAIQALSDPSGLPRRVVIKLALKDCRAAIFRLGGGTFIRTLRESPATLELLGTELGKARTQEVGQTGVMDLLQANLLLLRVSTVDTELFERGRVTPAAVGALVLELDEAIAAHDLLDESLLEGTLGSTVYNRFLVSAVLHAAKLYLHRLVPSQAPYQEASVRRILLLSLATSKDPSRCDTPASIWALPLFFAATVTQDKIYQSWILNRLKQAEKWGVNIRRTRELLEVVIKRDAQLPSGQYADVYSVMLETTGLFVC